MAQQLKNYQLLNNSIYIYKFVRGWHFASLLLFLDMRNKLIVLTLIIISYFPVFAQTLYSERFNTLTLNTGTYSSSGSIQTYSYKDVPSTMFTINNGLKTADTLTGNYPFRANGQKLKAFLSYKQANQADTFAVSTSWLKPTGVADAWLITPTINSIALSPMLFQKTRPFFMETFLKPFIRKDTSQKHSQLNQSPKFNTLIIQSPSIFLLITI